MTRGISKRRLIVTAAIVLALLVVPVAVGAVGGAFTDDDTSVFEADIEWLAGSGVTKGCNPPANTRFCPDDDVTRGQMAAFMRRFAQFLGAEDGVVNAADRAADADTVDGIDASTFHTDADAYTKAEIDAMVAAAAAELEALATTTVRIPHWAAQVFNGSGLGTSNGCTVNVASSAPLNVPVALPEGASFSSVELFGIDFSNTNDYTARFYRFEASTNPSSPGIVPTQLGPAVNSGGASFANVVSTIDFGGVEVVDPGETFVLVFSPAAAGFNHGFCQLEIEYQRGLMGGAATGDAPGVVGTPDAPADLAEEVRRDN